MISSEDPDQITLVPSAQVYAARVLFQTGSRLEKIGSGCFYNSALEEITVPRSVVEIQENAFK